MHTHRYHHRPAHQPSTASPTTTAPTTTAPITATDLPSGTAGSTADPSSVDPVLDVRRIATPGPCETAPAGRDASPLAAAGRDASPPHAALDTRRVCAWCEQPLPDRARRDAVCCSKRCRQARHRFTRTLTQPAARGPAQHDGPAPPQQASGRRLAYADPPYPGLAHLYRGHPDYAGEVDHAALITRLTAYDGWALSTSARALPAVLALCPPDVRVAAWHRGERPTRSRHPLSAWEPVIYHGAGLDVPTPIEQRRTDSLVHGIAPMTTLPGRVIGAKPAAFCRWLFTLLAATPANTLDDLFPGSGAVTHAWTAYTRPVATAGRHDPSRPAGPDPSPLQHNLDTRHLDLPDGDAA